MSQAGPNIPDAPLSDAQRSRGRRLAIISHPAGMTFRMVFTQHLPTLALVTLGASELEVGIQGSFAFGFIALQLPTLRAVGRLPKRTILVSAHAFAVLAAVPLLFFRDLADLGGQTAVSIALLSFGLVAVGHSVCETVWFPMLRSYVEPQRVGRFFGTLRTGWHLALIGYFSLSQWWLAGHPGDFAPLFALAWALGVARIGFIVRMPERSERTGEPVRIREALALLRDSRLRSYLFTVSWSHAARYAVLPFVVVMLRRVIGFDDGEVLYTTVALFAGGLVSLLPWGGIADRVGAIPVLKATTIGQGLLVITLVAVGPGLPALVPLLALWFFAYSVLASGFGVADTHILFELTPPEAPARTIVLANVVSGVAAGLAPLLAGIGLQVLLPVDDSRAALEVYHAFFVVAGIAQALAFLPLRRLVRARSA